MKKLMLSVIATALLATVALPVAAQEAPTLTAATPLVISTNTQIPNPFVDCHSLQEAAKLTGFALDAPNMVRGYPERSIQVMDNKMIQVIYENGQGKDIRLRKAAGTGDISGDFNKYTQITRETIAGVTATVKRTNARIYVAIWEKDGYTYSVTSSHGLDNVTLEHLIQAKEAEEPNAQLPSPLIDCKTLHDAAEITGFSLTVPETISGYPGRSIHTISKTTIQVIYRNQDENEIVIRKAAGDGDISGNYVAYPEVQTKNINGLSVTCKGKNGKVCLATWTNQGYAYSISTVHSFIHIDSQNTENGLSHDALNQLVLSVR